MATEMNMDLVENTTEPVSKNFIEMIIEKDLAEGICTKVITRFPDCNGSRRPA